MSDEKQLPSRVRLYLNDYSGFDEINEEDETVNVYDKMVSDLDWNLPTKVQMNRELHKQQSTTPTPQTKKRSATTGLMKTIETEVANIPSYLTRQNPSFRQLLDQLPSNTSVEATDTLRKIAILIHKTMILNHYHRLWTAYLQSGMGELISSSEQGVPPSPVFYSTTISIWPKQVREQMETLKNINKKNENEIYFHFVTQHLNELQYQLNNYQTLLITETNRFPSYTLDMRTIIESYIDRNLRSFCMKIDHEIGLTRFDYHIQALKLEYLRHNPNKYQEQRMKEVCRSSYEQETAEQQYHFLKRQIEYYTNSPNESFQSSPIGQSVTESLVNLFGNARNMQPKRQQVFQQFQTVAEKARNDIFEIDLKIAEEQRKEYRKQYEDNVKTMWSGYRGSTNRSEFLSHVMVQLITARCEKISERVQCVYKFKANMKNI